MKNHLVILGLVLSVAPFAFWKFEGPFYDENLSYDDLSYSLQNITKTDTIFSDTNRFDNLNMSFINYLHLFMYNKNLSYSIVSGISCPTRLLQSSNFFNCETNYQDFIDQNLFFYSVKEPLNIESNESSLIYDPRPAFEKLKKSIVREAINKGSDIPYYPYGEFLENNFILAPGIQVIKTTESCIQLSNVKIDNKDDRVEISKNGGTPISFQQALTDYYEPDLTQLAQDVRNNRVGPVLEKFRKITNVGKAEIQRLKNSTIIAVYAVLKGDDNKDSIIWGLAQDNNNLDPETNKFHWITDLENDISVLVN